MRVSPLLLLAAFGVFGVTAVQAQGQRPPTTVEIAAVSVAPAVERAELIGSLRAAEQVTIAAELAGRVASVDAAEGQPVTAGARLFTLDQALLRAELAEREAAFELSQRNFDRAKEMAAKKLVPQSDYDQSRSSMEVARASLQSTRVRLEKTELRAPFAGIMGLRTVSEGEYVSAGQRLASLAQIDPIKLDVQVPERYLAQLRLAQPVRVQIDALGGRAFVGAVYAIDPVVDPVSRTVALRASFDNPAGELKPGMFARVGIELGRQAQALWIPEEALVPGVQQTTVFKVVDGRAVSTPVQTGLREPGKVQVTAGLSAGDRVVTAGQIKIGDGAPVAAAGEGSP
ncbi:MAG: efflux RND transporter periplasmic adaptor subunit [Lysobacterales bacterium]